MMSLLVGQLFVDNPKDRVGESVKAMMHEYWVANSRVSPNARDMI